jgi:hypothetical protein
MDHARPAEIEPWTNRQLIHPVANWLLPPAIRLRLHPNLVTFAGLVAGLLAALAYTRWTDWRLAALGFALMLVWHVMDGLDGRLARATGQSSPAGRLIDGLADYATFTAVYCALAFTHPDPGLAVPAAMIAGVAHALQSAHYEGERETFVRRTRHQFLPLPRTEAGGPFERLYNKGEAMLGNHARPLDRQLSGAGPAQMAAMLKAWRADAARILRLMEPLSANGRTLAIFLAVLAGDPLWFWAFETIILTALALGGWVGLRRAEENAIQTGS